MLTHMLHLSANGQVDELTLWRGRITRGRAAIVPITMFDEVAA